MKPKGSGEDEMAEFKKTNVGMLRVPFDTKVSQPWINAFRNTVLAIFIVLCLIVKAEQLALLVLALLRRWLRRWLHRYADPLLVASLNAELATLDASGGLPKLLASVQGWCGFN